MNAEISKVEDKIQPFKDEINELQKQIDELRGRQREVASKSREIETAELLPLRRELSAAAQASGGLRMTGEGIPES